MDLLFHEYASPFLLLDGVISSGRLVEFIDTFEKQLRERDKREYFIHKLPPWDERTWDEFCRDVDGHNDNIQEQMTMSSEQLETTIKNSYNMMIDFDIGQEERG